MRRRASALFASLTLLACAPAPPGPRSNPAPEPPHVAEAAQRPLPAPLPPAAEPSRDGWNDAQIRWETYEAGLARARAERRPMCVVMHADWCVHCRNYSHVFEDPRIVERARDLVMVRLDVDDEREIAARFQEDGGYVPRTYFVSADGTTLAVDAQRDRFRYFFDESDPRSLLSGMERALAQR